MFPVRRGFDGHLLGGLLLVGDVVGQGALVLLLLPEVKVLECTAGQFKSVDYLIISLLVLIFPGLTVFLPSPPSFCLLLVALRWSLQNILINFGKSAKSIFSSPGLFGRQNHLRLPDLEEHPGIRVELHAVLLVVSISLHLKFG